jgi:hypothetical protein
MSRQAYGINRHTYSAKKQAIGDTGVDVIMAKFVTKVVCTMSVTGIIPLYQ